MSFCQKKSSSKQKKDTQIEAAADSLSAKKTRGAISKDSTRKTINAKEKDSNKVQAHRKDKQGKDGDGDPAGGGVVGAPHYQSQ